MDASEGGNHPQPVLLIGGPKHGEFMNLPKDQEVYEFVSDRTLTSPSGVLEPRTASHRYRYDSVLNRAGGPCNLFTHEVLWDSPVQGGFNLHALREAERAIVEARDALRARDEVISDLEEQVKFGQEELEDLSERYDAADAALTAIRNQLERIGQDALTAVALTKRDYTSAFPAMGGLQGTEEHDAELE